MTTPLELGVCPAAVWSIGGSVRSRSATKIVITPPPTVTTQPPTAVASLPGEIGRHRDAEVAGMAWVHDTGYGPAYAHSGYPVSVLADGSETGSVSARVAAQVIGWRAGCDCGWRGPQFYPRAEWPSRDGHAPIQLEGWETGSGIYAEWDRHLNGVLPELAVYDAARELAGAQARLDQAVRIARRAGRSWPRIAAVAGISADRAAQRWGAASGSDAARTPPAAPRGQWPTR